MAYIDDINALSPDIYYTFDNTLLDTLGGNTWAAGSSDFSTNPIVEDSSYSLRTNATSENPAISATTAALQGSSNKTFSMWFKVTAIQGPPTLIYREGGTTAGFALILWAGNNVMLQVWDNSGAIMKQVYCDSPLTSNRNYNFVVKWEDNNGGDYVNFYIDGVAQSSSNVATGIGQTYTVYTGVPEIGNTSAGDIPVGNGQVLLVAPVTAYYAHRVSWNSIITDQVIWDTIFGLGALPEHTIVAAPESGLQTQLNGLTGTECGDYPLSINIQEVTGGGDLSLSLNNVTFNSRASAHIRYEGTGTLTITNLNGSNATKFIGSNIVIQNPYTLTLTNIQTGTEIRVYEAGTQTEVAGEETVTTGVFSSDIAVSSVDIRIVSLDFKITSFLGVNMVSDISINLEQFIDRVYENN